MARPGSARDALIHQGAAEIVAAGFQANRDPLMAELDPGGLDVRHEPVQCQPPDGMAAMFESKYFWKMPPDVQMEVGPTVIVPLPKNYLAATEKYAGQIKIIELPDGGLTLQDYRGGIPFPNPQEPHRGWKVLMNLWYRYTPRLLVVTHGWTCAINASGSANCETYEVIDRQLSYSTDGGVTAEAPAPTATKPRFNEARLSSLSWAYSGKNAFVIK